MKLAAAYPVVEGYKQKPAPGYYFHSRTRCNSIN